MNSKQQSSAQQPVVPEEWRIILELATSIRKMNPALPQPYMWPIRGLARRSANISGGLAVLVMNGLWAEALILGRSLMEMEITLKWLLSGDTKKRLNRYIGAIRDEEKRLCRKMTEGVSVSAQILSELIGDQLRDRLAKGVKTPGPASYHGPKSRWPYLPIREMAREVDLERNYDLGYWIESIFAHVHPLSILESHPSHWDHLLCPLFTCEAREGLPRALCLVALPASVLHVFATVNDALNLGLQTKIEKAWKAVHALLRDEDSGIRWEPSIELSPGEVRVYSTDGTVKRYTPKRSSKDRRAKRVK